MDLKTLRFEYFEKTKNSIFDHFLTFFEKTKKKPIFPEKRKNARFFIFNVRYMSEKWSNFHNFSFPNRLMVPTAEKKFLWSYHGNSKNKLQIPEKKNNFPFFQTTLKSLPTSKTFMNFVHFLPKKI